MAFDSLTQKGSMGFNSGAPKHQLNQGAYMPIVVPQTASERVLVAPIERVNEIGARPPVGPITQD